jgi:hypothetical protein
MHFSPQNAQLSPSPIYYVPSIENISKSQGTGFPPYLYLSNPCLIERFASVFYSKITLKYYSSYPNAP